MPSIIEHLFEEILGKMVVRDAMKPCHIANFLGIFPDQFIELLPLVEQKLVKKIHAPSDRCLFRVYNLKTTKKVDKLGDYDYNYCLVAGNLCNCSHWKYDGCMKDELILCKHLLLAKIAAAINTYEIIEVSEEDFEDIMVRIISTH